MSTQVQGQESFTPATTGPLQPTLYVRVPGSSTVGNFSVKACLGLGICQLLCGVLLLILGIIRLVLRAVLSGLGSAIWCGIFFIVTGSLGIGASRTKLKCLIIATLVCSTISASVSGGYLFPFEAAMANTESPRRYNLEVIYDEGERIAVDITAAAFALAECVIAIIHSVICCRAVCCGKQTEMSVYYQVVGQPAVNVMPQGVPVINPYSGYPAAQPQPLYPQVQPYNLPAEQSNPQGQAIVLTEQPVVASETSK